MATTLGLSFKISADSSAARKAIADFRQSVQSNVSSIRQAVGNAGSQLQSVGAKMTAAITLPLVGLVLRASKQRRKWIA